MYLYQNYLISLKKNAQLVLFSSFLFSITFTKLFPIIVGTK